MRRRSVLAGVAAAWLAAAGWPALARGDRSLTVRPVAPGPHRHGSRRTAASPNVPVEGEAGESIDGPTAHGNCSTAGGGSGNAAMAASNC